MSSELTANSNGSVWHRWDPHIHAPGTVLNDQFGGDWSAYLTKINQSSPTVRALGVTDYFCIEGYRQVRSRWLAGELPKVGLVFPNVELRLDIKTDKKRPINLHLLFSPDDSNHQDEIERLLSRLLFKGVGRDYACTRTELIELGKHFNPGQMDTQAAFREGVRQFKASFEQLLDLYNQDRWFRENCLVAVAGSNQDGTAGLAKDDSFVLQRRAIESFAHIVFASTPSQRAYWLGLTTSVKNIEETYGFLKPCLHGSDGHDEKSTVSPADDRFCWLRGDLSFDTLRQAVVEPDRRIVIGAAPPPDGGTSASVVSLEVTGTPWLETPHVPMNSGLVAIVGAKGSGKTALVEMIAHAAGETGWVSNSSFLSRAGDHLSAAAATIEWGDPTTPYPISLRTSNANLDIVLPGVRYLSQHFVERLCSETGLAVELRRELERVVFNATDPTQRMMTDSFEELRDTLIRPIARSRNSLREQILTTSESIVQEQLAIDSLPKAKEERTAQEKSLQGAHADLAKLIPKDAEAHAKRLAELNSAYAKVSSRVESLRRREKLISDFEAEVARYREVEVDAELGRLQERYSLLQLTQEDWSAFAKRFTGNVDGILLRESKLVAEDIAEMTSALPQGSTQWEAMNVNNWPLDILKLELRKVQEAVGLDGEMQKRYTLLQRQISEKEGALRKLNSAISSGEGAPLRLKSLIDRRRGEYRRAFTTFLDEEAVLRELYAPLAGQIAASGGSLSKMEFQVSRIVNIEAWARRGESLLDLRRTSSFRGEGALQKIAAQKLAAAWRDGSAEEASSAVHAFFTEFRTELLAARPMQAERENRRSWEQSLALWLYDTRHIEVQYSITYNNTTIEKLSSGRRGIVLLLLFLVLDRTDRRPLVIDQPEENLDPQSVFAELVPHFREARKRRQGDHSDTQCESGD